MAYPQVTNIQISPVNSANGQVLVSNGSAVFWTSNVSITANNLTTVTNLISLTSNVLIANTITTNVFISNTITTNTITTNSITTNTISSNSIILSSGGSSFAPLLFTSGTNLSIPAAGSIEYDGNEMYFTPRGTQRGVIPSAQYYQLNTGFPGLNATGAQNTYGVGVTLSSNTTYAFEALFAMNKPLGATSHTISLGFGGTANNYSILYVGTYEFLASAYTSGYTTTLGNFTSNTSSLVVVTGAIASAAYSLSFWLKGTVNINNGGTFIPQYALSAAPGNQPAYTTLPGSYFSIYPIGTSTANISIGTWA